MGKQRDAIDNLRSRQRKSARLFVARRTCSFVLQTDIGFPIWKDSFPIEALMGSSISRTREKKRLLDKHKEEFTRPVSCGSGTAVELPNSFAAFFSIAKSPKNIVLFGNIIWTSFG